MVSDTSEVEEGGSQPKASSDNIMKTLSKKQTTQKDWECGSVGECSASKLEPLSSTSSKKNSFPNISKTVSVMA